MSFALPAAKRGAADMARRYETAIWPGNDAERARWAVLGPTGCYTFPTRYGRKAAEALAERMNREA